ncbi:hypothetical protein BV22DRAFT_737738 [Leucogyrophana mollusca]|uniref:Uncharacterized protein n=1 Tax=Leucogyrophana mollusca TaxID=85980 RepID=A0ACB8B6K1_9AGAM|nr:hypothetical protein BV22DRAFT_737738 [Leucogyrophana mollusca]
MDHGIGLSSSLTQAPIIPPAVPPAHVLPAPPSNTDTQPKPRPPVLLPSRRPKPRVRICAQCGGVLQSVAGDPCSRCRPLEAGGSLAGAGHGGPLAGLGEGGPLAGIGEVGPSSRHEQGGGPLAAFGDGGPLATVGQGGPSSRHEQGGGPLVVPGKGCGLLVGEGPLVSLRRPGVGAIPLSGPGQQGVLTAGAGTSAQAQVIFATCTSCLVAIEIPLHHHPANSYLLCAACESRSTPLVGSHNKPLVGSHSKPLSESRNKPATMPAGAPPPPRPHLSVPAPALPHVDVRPGTSYFRPPKGIAHFNSRGEVIVPKLPQLPARVNPHLPVYLDPNLPATHRSLDLSRGRALQGTRSRGRQKSSGNALIAVVCFLPRFLSFFL